ncbi:MAG: IS5 family transposase [Propionibacteriaceae bacterium]|nr:IS5 family transposase [Propionibacteriaceae bacterium]
MGRRRKERKPLPPIWECSDDLWALIEPILAEHDPPKQGPPRIDQRGAFDAIIFRLRTGCQWNRLPWEYPDESSVHRTFQRWVKLGIFEKLWAVVQEQCEDLGGCDWEWQAADGWLGKARLGGDDVGPNPTDRATPGVKRSLLVEADGGPLAITIAGANVPDAQLLGRTIDAIVLERPEPEPDFPQHLYLDTGYDNDTGWEAAIDHGDDPHIAMIRDERPPRPKRHKARRWVAERTISWLSKCRGLLIWWEKEAANYLSLLQVACALLWFRRLHRLARLG